MPLKNFSIMTCLSWYMKMALFSTIVLNYTAQRDLAYWSCQCVMHVIRSKGLPTRVDQSHAYTNCVNLSTFWWFLWFLMIFVGYISLLRLIPLYIQEDTCSVIQRRPKLTLTRPKDPKLETAQRVRAVRIKSSAELEAEMLAKIPKFKARPLNKKVSFPSKTFIVAG